MQITNTQLTTINTFFHIIKDLLMHAEILIGKGENLSVTYNIYIGESDIGRQDFPAIAYMLYGATQFSLLLLYGTLTFKAVEDDLSHH